MGNFKRTESPKGRQRRLEGAKQGGEIIKQKYGKIHYAEIGRKGGLRKKAH